MVPYTPSDSRESAPAAAEWCVCSRLFRLIVNLWPRAALGVTGLSGFTREFAFPVSEAVLMQLGLLSHVKQPTTI